MKKFIITILSIFFAINNTYAFEYQEVRAEHILVKTKQEATELINKIENGQSFEDLAKIHSLCPSGKNGGDLGYFGKGQMVPEFENPAFNMAIEEISEPIQTQFGWHIIKVIDKR